MPPKNTPSTQRGAPAAPAQAAGQEDQIILQEPYVDRADHQLVEDKILEHVPENTKNFKIRNWFLTYWVREEPRMLVPRGDNIIYYCTQLEVCPTTERLHGHMYIEFKDPITRAALVKLLKVPSRDIWTAARRGTQKQAIDYCRKDDTRLEGHTPFHYGTPKRAGSRSDLDVIAESVFDGFTKAQIVAAYGGNGLRHLGMVDRLQRSLAGDDSVDNFITIKKKLWLEHNERRAQSKLVRDREPIPFWRFNLVYNAAEVKSVYNGEYHDQALELVSDMRDQKELEDEEEREGRYNESMLLAIESNEARGDGSGDEGTKEPKNTIDLIHPLVAKGFPETIPVRAVFPAAVPDNFIGILNAKTLQPMARVPRGIPHYVLGMDDKKNFYFSPGTGSARAYSISDDEGEDDEPPPSIPKY